MEKDVLPYIERLESIVQAGFNGLHQEMLSIKDETCSKIDALSDRMLESAADTYFDSLEKEEKAARLNEDDIEDEIGSAELDPVDELVHSPINSMIK